jgi:hypothetical protein
MLLVCALHRFPHPIHHRSLSIHQLQAKSLEVNKRFVTAKSATIKRYRLCPLPFSLFWKREQKSRPRCYAATTSVTKAGLDLLYRRSDKYHSNSDCDGYDHAESIYRKAEIGTVIVYVVIVADEFNELFFRCIWRGWNKKFCRITTDHVSDHIAIVIRVQRHAGRSA